MGFFRPGAASSGPGGAASRGETPGDVPSRTAPSHSAARHAHHSADLPARARRPAGYIRCSTLVVDSKAFTAFTMLLTVYALLGDDVRLIATSMRADDLFNLFTAICLVVFSVEIALCTIGKKDYFLSFFFCLDIVSTLSLLLDLTWLNDALQGNEDSVSNVSGSQTAQIGARASRIIRVIRLVRVVKLYKAVLEAKRVPKKSSGDPGDEDNWDDIQVEEVKLGSRKESRVGRKLSELTTRRVILLVLLMMIMQRLMRMDSSQQYAASALYAANLVHEAFVNLEANRTDPDLRWRYEQLVLNFIYYHNWYTNKRGSPVANRPSPADAQSQLFWIGIVANSEDVLERKIGLAQLRNQTVVDFDARINRIQADPNQVWLYNFGGLPAAVQLVLGMRWDARCNEATRSRVGVSLLGEVNADWGNTYPVRCPTDLRRTERKLYAPDIIETDEFNTWHFVFYFDLRPFSTQEAMFSLLTTGFVCLSLCCASVLFTNDANRLVLHPVENMIAKVETIRDNPLMAMKVADEEFKMEEINRAKARKLEQDRWQMVKDRLLCLGGGKSAPELMETVILEKTIIKLGSLLVLGFGEAGASIIEHNMNGVDTAAIDAMVEGTRVECIIGAARIRDFSTATEVLQAKVMSFVNQIAEIVHGVVDEFHGYASKNNSDTFLMIWRSSVDMHPDRRQKLADMSMMAFVRILGAVHRSPVLAAYRSHPGLLQRMGRSCRVNLSFGLHFGWAIEGAVGSEFKIDASYLSPNVSIAESVERATQLYGVSILVAESVVRICTAAMAQRCRLIDRVIIRGSVEPMDLYVIDLDHLSLTVDVPSVSIPWSSRQRFRARQKLEADKAAKWHEDVQMVQYFFDDPDIAAMQFRFTLEFIQVFNMGYQNYSQGEWAVAEKKLSRTKVMLGVPDGPSAALLDYMKRFQSKVPPDWKGVRELDQRHFS